MLIFKTDDFPLHTVGRYIYLRTETSNQDAPVCSCRNEEVAVEIAMRLNHGAARLADERWWNEHLEKAARG